MIKRELLTGAFALTLIVMTGWLWLSADGLSAAPAVTFRLTDGRQIHLRELRGKPVLVTFWATSCPGCIKEMPRLITLYRDLSASGLEIIGVAMAYDPPNQVLELTRRRAVPYPIALDIDGGIAAAFANVSLTPTSFLIAPDGRIVRHRIGEMDMESLRTQIMELLASKPLASSHPQALTAGS